MPPKPPRPLTPTTLLRGVSGLAARDAHLAGVAEHVGPPPLGGDRPVLRRSSGSFSNSMARAWAPWRAVAARILWHAYLSFQRSP